MLLPHSLLNFVEHGIFQQATDKYTSNYLRCKNQKKEEVLRPLAVYDFLGIFSLIAVGTWHCMEVLTMV